MTTVCVAVLASWVAISSLTQGIPFPQAAHSVTHSVTTEPRHPSAIWVTGCMTYHCQLLSRHPRVSVLFLCVLFFKYS